VYGSLCLDTLKTTLWNSLPPSISVICIFCLSPNHSMGYHRWIQK